MTDEGKNVKNRTVAGHLHFHSCFPTCQDYRALTAFFFHHSPQMSIAEQEKKKNTSRL